MADKKISQLTAATTPLAGTEVLPIVQSGETRKASVESVLTSAQPSGTANAIAYLNATKQLTYNAKYTFDGTSFQTLLNPTYVNGGYKSARDSLSGGVYNTFDFIEGVTTTGYLRNYGSVYGAGLNNQIHLWNTQNANIVVGVNNATAGSFTTNGLAFPAGKGIDFSANANAPGMTSELLTWYEEGTWTPVIEGSSSAGTATYVARSGTYTRIGRVVYIQAYVVWNSGTGTGDLRLSGLPFFAGAGTQAYGGVFFPVIGDITATASNVISGGYVLSGSGTIRITQTPVGGGSAYTSVPYDASGEFMVVGQYFT